MAYSKLVGTQGVAKANETMQKSMDDKGKAKSYEDQALEDAAECDQNMADADAFVKEVEETERDLAAQQAMATQFLQQLHAAVQAEKARQEQEKQKKLAEQQAQQAAAGGGASAPAVVAAPVPKAPKNPADKKPNQPKPLNPSAVGKVKNAASYVVAQTTVVIDQLTASKQEQVSRLTEKLGEKGILKRITFNTSHVGDKVLADAKVASGEIASSMRDISNGSPTTAGDLQREAGNVKGKAKQVDELSHIANEQLNAAFKQSYEALGNA
jgi:hypothetical protein